ncbi:MAG: hypothetical protein QOD64_2134 [Verrucomicrobiota bacterium]|jgi:threonine dehydrogenase-like Zn-dependent dehydrogenase
MITALSIARPGGVVGRLGVPHDQARPASLPAFFNNIYDRRRSRSRARYIEELLPDVLEGRIKPGRVFDRTTNLDGVPDGYRSNE